MKSCTDDRTPAASAEDQARKGRLLSAIIAFYVGPTSSTSYSYVFDFIFLRLRLHIPMASTSLSYGFPSMSLRLLLHVVFHIPLSGRGIIAVLSTGMAPSLTGLRAASGVFRDVHDGLCTVGFSQVCESIG
ncbi:hypothetical protein K523DRAFT_128539 [Schizophyllum commune Tattone D]|nr:hypothetical protein K523DRAFT_128539 [Schizophyllum commune Tattone D]